MPWLLLLVHCMCIMHHVRPAQLAAASQSTRRAAGSAHCTLRELQTRSGSGSALKSQNPTSASGLWALGMPFGVNIDLI
jgi:hypothetical protein